MSNFAYSKINAQHKREMLEKHLAGKVEVTVLSYVVNHFVKWY